MQKYVSLGDFANWIVTTLGSGGLSPRNNPYLGLSLFLFYAPTSFLKYSQYITSFRTVRISGNDLNASHDAGVQMHMCGLSDFGCVVSFGTISWILS